MNFDSVEAIANAILYEGYILYPYRPSSIKNRQRWNFGTIYPRMFAEMQKPPERWRFQTELLVEANEHTSVFVRARFLQLVSPAQTQARDWNEGFTRCAAGDDISLPDLLAGVERSFDLTGLSAEESARAPVAFREQSRVATLRLEAQPVREGIYRLRAAFANESPALAAATLSRQTVQDTAFISAHLLLGVESGAFVSLLEPPPELESDAKACVQDGVFPVLAGEVGDRTRMLCSPIILYDYPQVAPESAGDFFDGTEMDEMLALRVLTLTDDEKAEMRRGDPHARAILERTETLPNEQLLKVHGAVRGLRRVDHEVATAPALDGIIDPWDPFAERPPVESVRVFGTDVRKGDRVRLWPHKKADIMDMVMHGKVAIIEAIEQDLEDNVQFAVVLEDDPGRDMGMLRQAGHRFFFSPEEVEPLGMEIA
jgi:hypothetical protein